MEAKELMRLKREFTRIVSRSNKAVWSEIMSLKIAIAVLYATSPEIQKDLKDYSDRVEHLDGLRQKLVKKLEEDIDKGL